MASHIMRAARMSARVIARPRVGLVNTCSMASARSISTASNAYKSFWTLSRMAVAGFATTTAVSFTSFIYAKEYQRADWVKIGEEIANIISSAPDNYDDGSYGPMFVRLAWHASGTYDKNKKDGGSNGGRIRFEPEAKWSGNNGLDLARSLLEPLKQRHPEISYADLYTYAGVVAIEEMSGPKIPWRPGRTDDPDGSLSPKGGRLPDGDKDQSHVREVFYRMGFNDREIVALCGAHALGRCHTDRSGFTGPWTRMPTTFSNEYFRELIENTWTPKKWNGPKQYEDPTGELMMLETDLALIRDPEFRKWVEIYAKDQNLFFKDFAVAFSKLLELGVPFPPVPS